MHQIPELEQKGNETLEDQREKLIRRLIGFSADRKIEFHLIFDSSRIRGSGSLFPGVRVTYTGPTADDYIRGIIKNNRDNRSITIVSSDRKDIGIFAKESGVPWQTSKQFWQQMTKRRKPTRAGKIETTDPPKKPSTWTSADDAWLKRAFED